MKTISIRAKILVGLGAASLALGAAGPAGAADDVPVDQDGKKSCATGKTKDDGSKEYVQHGSIYWSRNPDGTGDRLVKCVDGAWKPYSLEPRQATTYDGTPGSYEVGDHGTTSPHTGTSSGPPGTYAATP